MRSPILSRRCFLAASTLAASSAMLPSTLFADEMKTKLHKAQMVGKIAEPQMSVLKAAGFEGVETTNVCSEEDAAKGREIAEKAGMRVHSVLRGWMKFNSPDPKVVETSLEEVRKSLRAAKAYASDAILLVPCRIEAKGMPAIADIAIDFNESNGHVKSMVKGDNAPHADYIAAHNVAIDMSRAAVEKLIPLAEELKIVIGLENVWNNLWVKPEIYRHFVASFKSPWVKAYFDIGNHVKYAPPQDWIKALGGLLIKLHMKDFDLAKKSFVQLRNGSVDWPAVRRALDEAGYNGWGTIEGGNLPLDELNKRFDLICEGK
jgi:L-ribulose-5-phosphate 3-epimerase